MRLPKLPNSVYDWLKWMVLVALPAINTAIFGLGELYGFDAHYICGTITIGTALIGALIGVSTIGYNKSKEVKQNDEEL